jgi:hypothetical protein
MLPSSSNNKTEHLQTAVCVIDTAVDVTETAGL